MFDVSIYTDCTPSEALDGVDGFNFQGASEGFTPTDQRAVREHMLHQVVMGWALENDPFAHPPSCRYRPIGERFYLTRGRSTGTTNNQRNGNQLTQALATGNADDFTPYRPAQLFGARRWNLEKGPGKSLDPWATPLDVDTEFEASELKDSLLSDPWASQLLPAFLTMIEQAAAEPSKKLIIVHDDLEHTMKWIALGTLFLDPKRAGAVRFAALVNSPLAMDAEIVGTSPVFGSPPPAVGDTAYNVFDVIDRQVTSVEVSRSAAEQAAWFIDMDAEDALAAVDLARSWELAVGAVDATRLARIIHLGGSEDTIGDGHVALRAIPSIIKAGQGDDVAMYADELLSVALQSVARSADDVRAAAHATWATRQAGIDTLAVELNAATLRGVSGQPSLAVAWAHEMADLSSQGAASTVDVAHQRQYEHSIVDVINTAPVEAMSDLLAVAKSFGLSVPAATVGPGLTRFEELWARNPGISDSRALRAYRAESTAGAVARLVRLLEAGDRAATSDLLDRQWHWVAEEIRTPLDGWIAAADLSSLPPADRVERLGDKVRSVGIPTNSWPLVMAGLDWPADCRLIARWIDVTRVVPESMNQWLTGEIDRSLRLPDSEAAAVRPVLVALLKSGLRIDGHHLDRVLDDMRRIAQSFRAAQKSIEYSDNRALEDFATRLGRYRPFFLNEIGALLPYAQDSRALRRLIHNAGDSAVPAMVQELRKRFDRDDPLGALELGLYLNLHGLAGQADGARAFLTFLADSRESRAQIEGLKRDLSEEWSSEWHEFLSENKKGRMTRNFVRGGKRLFGKDGELDG